MSLREMKKLVSMDLCFNEMDDGLVSSLMSMCLLSFVPGDLVFKSFNE
jgi:hypothetical protein